MLALTTALFMIGAIALWLALNHPHTVRAGRRLRGDKPAVAGALNLA
jgi:hypothetical protein